MFDSGHHLVLKSYKTLSFGDRTSSDGKNTHETYSFGHDGEAALSLGLGN
jgi:hypothetical protein